MLEKIYQKTKSFIVKYYQFIITITIVYALLFINLPYVIYAPGGEIDLKNRVKVNTNYDVSGSYNMTYVSMLNGNIPLVLLSFVIPNWDLEKTADVVYEDESINEMLETDKIYYEESINNATIAAFKEANQKLEIKRVKNEIVYIASYAKTDLKVGDILLSADGVNITDLEQYKTLVSNHKLGDIIDLVILRGDKTKNITIKVQNDNGEKKTGLAFVTLYDIKTNPTVSITVKESESGPSGGLMMALSIYDQLTLKDVAHGRKIAGTGTIDALGNVGEIGGIKYKLLGAIKNGADIFICPEANYQEAKEVLAKEKSNLKLISVSSLNEAITKLS
jgi:PDZ domain-containing protein